MELVHAWVLGSLKLFFLIYKKSNDSKFSNFYFSKITFQNNKNIKFRIFQKHDLSKQVKAHGFVGFFFRFFLLFLSWGSGITASGSSSATGWGSTTGWDGGEFAHAFSNDVVDVFAVEFGEDFVELFLAGRGRVLGGFQNSNKFIQNKNKVAYLSSK